MKKLGSYLFYQDDWATIYCGDCRDILLQLNPVDLVLTDPPYDEATHSGSRTKIGNLDGKAIVDKLITFRSFTFDELRNIFGLVNFSGWLIATVDWRHILPLEQRPPKGLRFVRFGIWNKTRYTPQFTGDRPATGWEAIIILHTEGGRMKWNGGGTRAVWTFDSVQNDRHPTEKPIGLFRELIQLFSWNDSIVLDPFLGSGTTCVAAKSLGRRSIGIEIEPKYCEIAAKRVYDVFKGANPKAILQGKQIKRKGIFY